MSFETPPVSGKKFLGNIQALRAIATLMIVMSHWRSIDTKYAGDALSIFDHFGFGRFAIDMFFVVSGFIMIYITWTSAEDIRARGKRSLRFLFARFTRIYPLYWIITASLIALYIVKPGWVFTSIIREPNFIKSFFLLPDYFAPFLAVAWTLVHELGFYLVFSILLLIPQGRRPIGLTIWAAIVFVGQLMDLRSMGPITNILLSPFSFDFIIGALLAYHYKTSSGLVRKPTVLWAFFIISFIWAYIAYTLYQPYIFDSLERVLIYILPATLCVYAMCELNRQNHLLPKWLQTIGNWSFALYLTHVLTLTVIGRLWAKFAQSNTPIDNIIVMAICILASIGVAGLTYNLIEQPLRKLSTRWQKKLFSKD